MTQPTIEEMVKALDEKFEGFEDFSREIMDFCSHNEWKSENIFYVWEQDQDNPLLSSLTFKKVYEGDKKIKISFSYMLYFKRAIAEAYDYFIVKGGEL